METEEMNTMPSLKTTISGIRGQIDRVRFYRGLSQRNDIETLPSNARRTLGLAD